MKDSNVIVLGANGMLGYVVAKYLSEEYNVTKLTSKEFNIITTPVQEFNKYIDDHTIAVINCAGIVKPRVSGLEVKDVFKINSQFPIQLFKMLSDEHLGLIDMIHVSTDCVFTGEKGNYAEADIQDSSDIYGMSKAIGETCSNEAMVIRTSIIGEELNNKYSLLEWAKSQAGKEVSGWTDHTWSGVTTLQLAKFINDVISKGEAYVGMSHYASKPINKYDLLVLISHIYELNLTVNKTKSGHKCDRSLATYSEEYDAPDLKLQLQEMREWFNNVRG